MPGEARAAPASAGESLPQPPAVPRAPAEQGKRPGHLSLLRRGLPLGSVRGLLRDRVIHASRTGGSCEGGEHRRLAPGGLRGARAGGERGSPAGSPGVPRPRCAARRRPRRGERPSGEDPALGGAGRARGFLAGCLDRLEGEQGSPHAGALWKPWLVFLFPRSC